MSKPDGYPPQALLAGGPGGHFQFSVLSAVWVPLGRTRAEVCVVGLKEPPPTPDSQPGCVACALSQGLGSRWKTRATRHNLGLQV